MSSPVQHQNYPLFHTHASSEQQIWDCTFKKLVEFKETNGDCNVPGRNTKLGRWVTAQRGFFRMGKLRHDRVERLNDIGFEWRLQLPREPSTNPFLNDVQFEAMLVVTKEYIKFQGHGWVPYRTPEVPKLGIWAHHLRTQKRQGALSNFRQLALENVGFVWEEPPPTPPPTLCNDAKFEAMLQVAAEYIRAQGHGWISGTTPQLPKLGTWAVSQRDKKRTDKLSTPRQIALDNIGFAWEAPSTLLDGFEAMLQLTAEYIRIQGHGWVPQQTPQFPKFGMWAEAQRDQKRAGKLSTPRQLALESIGFAWNAPPSTSFETTLQEVAEYIRVQGNGWVPSSTPENPKIGKWAQNQRDQKKAGELSPSKQSALESVGFEWEAPTSVRSNDARFQAMFQAATEYIRVEGNGWIPMRIPEFPKLGAWARTQRNQKRRGKMSTSRQLALESIGFVWEGSDR